MCVFSVLWRKRHKGRKVRARAAWSALPLIVELIMSGGAFAKEIAIRVPFEPLPCGSFVAKSIHVSDDDSESQIHIARFRGFIIGGGKFRAGPSMLELTLAGYPASLSSDPKSDSGDSKNDGKNGRHRAIMVIKNFSDFDDEEWKHAISGAIFLFGLFGFLAYLAVKRDQPKESDKKPRETEVFVMSIEDEVASFEEFKKEAEAKYLRFQPLIRPDEADFEERYTKRLAREGAAGAQQGAI